MEYVKKTDSSPYLDTFQSMSKCLVKVYLRQTTELTCYKRAVSELSIKSHVQNCCQVEGRFLLLTECEVHHCRNADGK